MTMGFVRRVILLLGLIVSITPLAHAQNNDTLSLITPDAIGLVSIRPAMFAQSKAMRRAPLEVITAAGIEYLGIDPLKIDRIDMVVGIPMAAPTLPFSLCITHSEPIDTAILKRFMPAGPVKEKGVDLWAMPNSELVLALRSTHQALIGPTTQVLRLMKTTPGDGPLRKLANSFEPGAAMQIMVAIEPLRELLVSSIQSPLLKSEPELVSNLTIVSEKASMLAMRIDAADKTIATYMLEGNSPADTVELGKALKVLSRLAMKEAIVNLERETRAGPGTTPAAVMAYAKRLSDEMEANLKFEPEGKRLSVQLEGQTLIMAQTGIAIGLLLPAVQAAREAARRASGQANLGNILMAMHQYQIENRSLPNNLGSDRNNTKANLSWRVHILPNVGEEALYKEFHLDEPWDSEHNIKLLERIPPVYIDPRSNTPRGHTVYQMPRGKNMLSDSNIRWRFTSMTDGLSNIIALIVTKDENSVPWTAPSDLDAIAIRDAVAVRDGAIDVGMLDGKTERLKADISAEDLQSLLTVNGNEEINWEALRK